MTLNVTTSEEKNIWKIQKSFIFAIAVFDMRSSEREIWTVLNYFVVDLMFTLENSTKRKLIS